MPSCVFIKTCWSLSKAYCIPRKLCHFQSSGIFKLQKNGWHYKKTNVICGLSAPKNIKKHQKIKIKKTRPKICCPVNHSFNITSGFWNQLKRKNRIAPAHLLCASVNIFTIISSLPQIFMTIWKKKIEIDKLTTCFLDATNLANRRLF